MRVADDSWTLDEVLPPCADEPVLVSLMRQLERGKINEDQIMLIPGLGADSALEAMVYLEAKGIDCSEVFSEMGICGGT